MQSYQLTHKKAKNCYMKKYKVSVKKKKKGVCEKELILRLCQADEVRKLTNAEWKITGIMIKINTGTIH